MTPCGANVGEDSRCEWLLCNAAASPTDAPCQGTEIDRIRDERKLIDDFDAHVAGGAGDDLDSSGFVVGVHVRLLELPDFGELLLRDLANFVLIRLSRTAGDIGRLLEKDG